MAFLLPVAEALAPFVYPAVEVAGDVLSSWELSTLGSTALATGVAYEGASYFGGKKSSKTRTFSNRNVGGGTIKSGDGSMSQRRKFITDYFESNKRMRKGSRVWKSQYGGEIRRDSKRLYHPRLKISPRDAMWLTLAPSCHFNIEEKCAAYSIVEGTSSTTQLQGKWDYDSPYQGCFVNWFMDKNQFSALFNGGSRAWLNQTSDANDGGIGSALHNIPWSDVVQDQATADSDQKLFLYGLRYTDSITNSCSLTQEVMVYVLKPRRWPLRNLKEVLDDFNKTNTLDTDTLKYGGVIGYSYDVLSNNGSTVTTNNANHRMYANTYGWTPSQCSELRYFYKIVSLKKYVIAPGETVKITYSCPKTFMVHSRTAQKHETFYPGLTTANMYICRSQNVGSNLVTSSDVGHGSGQLQVVRNWHVKAKVCPVFSDPKVYKRGLDTIAWANQQYINVENGILDNGPDEL